MAYYRDENGFYQEIVSDTIDLISRSNGEVSDEIDVAAGKFIRRVDPSGNGTLGTPVVVDADITILDQNGVSQDYWHLYANGQVSGSAEELLPVLKYKNLQHGDQIMADTHYGYKKQRLVGYAEEQTGNALNQIYRALNK